MTALVYLLAGTLAATITALGVVGVVAWRTKSQWFAAVSLAVTQTNRAQAAESQNAKIVVELAAVKAERDEANKQLAACQRKAADADLQTVATGDAAAVDAVIDGVLANQQPDLADDRIIADVDTVFDSAATQSVTANAS